MAKDFVVVALTFSEAEALERALGMVVVDVALQKPGERDAARRAIVKLRVETGVIRAQRERREGNRQLKKGTRG